MPTPSRRRDIARAAADTFGWDRLRPGQTEAVEALRERRDVLVVMPTGAGKSAVYQLAALLLDGPTVVVSPLIALQRDQLAGLAGAGSPDAAAVAVNSAQRPADSEQAWQSLRTGRAEFIFLAPEQLARDDVLYQLTAAHPSLFVVDEAHCVSAWGHDFRPEYLRVGDVLPRLGHPVVAALTATAAPPVRAEILDRLRMRDEPALALLAYRPEDLGLRRFFASRGGPDAQTLEAVARAVRDADGTVSRSELREALAVSGAKVSSAVNPLEQSGAVEVTSRGRLRWAADDPEVGAAVQAALEAAAAHARVDRSRVEMLRGYAETTGCRRQFLLGYFGEQLDDPCGSCDTCRSGGAVDEPPGPPAQDYPLNTRVHHRERGPGVVMRPEADRVTVLFEQVGYKTLAVEALRATPLLRRVDDPEAADRLPAAGRSPGPASPDAVAVAEEDG